MLRYFGKIKNKTVKTKISYFKKITNEIRHNNIIMYIMIEKLMFRMLDVVIKL